MKLLLNMFFLFTSLFLVKETKDYEKDLKLTISTTKFGVNQQDVIRVYISNLSDKDYRISYLDKPNMAGGCELYIYFKAFMRLPNGNWEELKDRINKNLNSWPDREKKSISLKAGKNRELFSMIFYPNKWFYIEKRKGVLKLTAEYIYKQVAQKETKDTVLLKIPSFKLHSDTLIFNVK